MVMFYDDPYSYIDDACESLERIDSKRSQAESLIAIAIILLALAEGRQEESSVPAAPIMYEDFPNGD